MVWKNITGYEDYEISNTGLVKSLKKGREIIMKSTKNTGGYYSISLFMNGKRKDFPIHKLVAMMFLGHIPNKYESVVDHINSDKLDNRVENLRIVTPRENTSKLSEKKNKKSSYIGVSFDKRENRTKKWTAKIFLNGVHKNLGVFYTEEEAYIAYENELNKNK